MAVANRSTLLGKLHKVCKKHYSPAAAVDRPLFEQMLFACCLENAPASAADEAFSALRASYFDWNEARVTTVKELSETVAKLPDPEAAASRVKRVMQGVFESTYSFELEALKKQNLGQAVQQLKKLNGASAFVVAYATQHSLGGHSIPVDRNTLEMLAVLGIVTPAEAAEGGVPGLERAIPKNRGIEFGSLVHALGAEFGANRYSPALHKILLEVAPDAKDRLPKRSKKHEEPPAAKPLAKPAAAKGKPPAASGPPKTPSPAKGDKPTPRSARQEPPKPTKPAKAGQGAPEKRASTEKRGAKDKRTTKSPAALPTKKKSPPPGKRKPR
jgi:endonuclease III